MNMKTFNVPLALVVLMSAVAVTQDVHYNSMPGIDFSKYHTYKWVAVPGAEQLNQIQESELKSAVDTQLAAKGFTPTTGDTADMYVGYQVSVNKEKEWNAYGTGGGWGWGGGMATATESTIAVGSVGLDFYDPAAKQLIWRGVATKTVNPSSNQEKNEKNLDKAMEKLLKHFPPEK
jgi:Domain of unknown function (DUF4136)